MRFLRSFVFNCCYVATTIVVGVLALPFLPAGWRANSTVSRVWSICVLRQLRFWCGLSGGLTGPRRGLPEGPVLVAMKHQSAWDTFFTSVWLPYPAIVLKRELLRVPFFGWYASRAHMLPIDRSGGTKTLKTLVATARQRLADGQPIVIYPEGTRTAPGAEPRYHPGVAALYLELGIPVVPVALNSGCFWGRNAFVKRPGRIAVEIQEAIPPGLDRRAFMRLLQERIEPATARLVAEASERT